MSKIILISLKVVLGLLFVVLVYTSTIAEEIDSEASINKSISKLEELLKDQQISQGVRDAVRVDLERLKDKLKEIRALKIAFLKISISRLEGVLDDPLIGQALKGQVKVEFEEKKRLLQEMEEWLEEAKSTYGKTGENKLVSLSDEKGSLNNTPAKGKVGDVKGTNSGKRRKMIQGELREDLMEARGNPEKAEENPSDNCSDKRGASIKGKESENSSKCDKNLEEGVQKAIELHKKGVSTSTITEILVTKPMYRFGNANLSKTQIETLTVTSQ